MRIRTHILITLVAISCLAFSACGIYSFTGTNISPDVKKIYFGDFPDQSSLVLPTFRQTFTEELIDRFLNNTNLTIGATEGDIEMEGAIVNTVVRPIASTGDDRASQNRLTITIRVDYVNKVEDDSWSQTFKAFSDFDATENLSNVEDVLIEEIVEIVTQDIFNKALVKW